MKTALKYLIFLLIPFLSSCWETNLKSVISEEYKPLLKNNDTILFFDSINNHTDTFKVSLTHTSADSDVYDYSEQFTIRYILINRTSFPKEFKISQGNRSVIISYDTNYFDRIEYTVNQPDVQKEDLLVRGVMYPNTYMLNQYRFETDTLPKTVYYSLKHGIIRYDYADGRKYELVSE